MSMVAMDARRFQATIPAVVSMKDGWKKSILEPAERISSPSVAQRKNEDRKSVCHGLGASCSDTPIATGAPCSN